MIYTGYFGGLHRVPLDVVPISICGKAPDWYKGAQYKKLAPKYSFWSIWKENHDNDYYIREYNSQVLSFLNKEKVLEDLYKLSDGKDIILLCYERPTDFCHRHLVADWLKDTLDVKEYVSIL